jgi:hypothetical protein
MITDFIAAPNTNGDRLVVAPDNSRARLVWRPETGAFFKQAQAVSA